MNVKICILQFERAANFKKNIEKVTNYLKNVNNPDFALIGGEFSLKESKNTNPYPPLIELAKKFNCNIVAPINGNLNRFPNLKQKGFSSIHIFNREGKVVAIQDKQNFYPKEKPWFRQGKNIKVFEVEGIKIGLIRGNDILHPEYVKKLKDAEIIFLATMAIDDIMLEAAKVAAVENLCFVVLSSFIGKYVGMDFIGNAAFIQPDFSQDKNKSIKAKILKHLKEEGILEQELDINHIRKIWKMD